MFKAERSGLLNEGQYGSRPRKSAYDPVLLEILQAEVSRITRKSLVQMNFDATSCYDRIIPSLANLASRKFDVPPTVAQMNVNTVEKMFYRLRTGLGISSTGYSHCDAHPIYGMGQGAGNTSQLWLFLSSVLLDSYKEQTQGAQYEFPDRTGRMSVHIVGFVDDSNGQSNQFLESEPVTVEALATQATHEINTWKSLLRASGGGLELSKCNYQIMSWGFTIAGGPILKGGIQGPKIYVTDNDTGQESIIPQLSAHSAHKTLGHFITPAGTNAAQLKVLKEKSDEIATKLMASGLTRSETWTYYFSTYLPSIWFPLPMQHFTRTELYQIQKKALNCIIARCGYNRHTHRSIIFGSTKYGGANFRHLYAIQGTGQTQVFLKYWRTPHSQAGRLLRISVAWLQRSVGVSFPIFEDVHTPLSHSESLWLMSMRDFLQTINGYLQIHPTYVPSKPRAHDAFIMDLVIGSTWFSPREIRVINWCRLYLQAIFVSDISNTRGTHIDPHMFKGEVNHAKSSVTTEHQFVQDRPSSRSWTLWRKANLLWSTEHGKLRQPLGSWQTPSSKHHRRAWPAHFANEQLYTRLAGTDHRYQVWTRAANTAHYTTAGNIVNINRIPVTATPADTRRQFPIGYSILATTESPPLNAAAETHHDSALAFFQALEPWESELISNTTFLTDETDAASTISMPSVIACDGAVNAHAAGAFGWVLSNREHHRKAVCAGPVRGSRISSYRAEGYGILSVTRFIHRTLEYTRMRTPCLDQLTIVCDNQSMVRKVQRLLLNTTDTLPIDVHKHHTLEPLQPEWDVLNEIWHTVKRWRGLQILHIKGHQDTNTAVHTLPLEATLNVQADALAGDYLRQNPAPRTRCHMFPNTHAHLHLNDSTITYRYALRIRNAECDPPMVAYLKEKYQWTDAIFDSINWTVHGKAVRSQHHRKTHITKLVHDILPTNKVQHRWNPQHCKKCPLCKQAEETRDHLLRCEKTESWRSKCLRMIGIKCANLRTHRGLESLMIRGLMAWFRGNESLTAEGYSADMTALVYSQNAIGWGQLFNGRWSNLWSLIQGNYMGDDVTQQTSPMGNRWNVAIIRELWTLWHDLWSTRNASAWQRCCNAQSS